MSSTCRATATQICAAIRAGFPQLQAAMSSTDHERRLPRQVLDLLRATGAYRMLTPAALQGTPVDLQGCLDVLETVSEANSAAGWNLATSTWSALHALRLPRQGAERLYASGPDMLFAGGFAGNGTASATDGGYRVTGHFHFGSGCLDADWMVVGCQLPEASGTTRDVSAPPARLLAFVPPAAVTVHDTWRVAGLRGTGSHDWSINEVFVPTSLATLTTAVAPWAEPLAHLPAAVFTAVHLSAVATGMARRAIDSLVALAGHKRPTGMAGLLRERVQVQEAVARAEVLVESARAYRAQLVSDVWATLEARAPVSVTQRARLRLAGTHAVESAVQAVDLMFHAGGTSAIEDACALSHCFRDIHVLAQNMNVLPLFYESAGRVFLGLDSGTPLI
ncbi:MAG: hypothetical protein AB7N91_00980 [Candidatus Tectimicrobiota bacterium]